MTKLRIIKVNERNLNIALENNIWGRKRGGYKDWEKGDYLLFIVDNTVAGLAMVDGKPFKSEDIYWEDDLYPNRIPIKTINKFETKNRISFLEKIKPILVEEWGKGFGWKILTQQAMTGKRSDYVYELCGHTHHKK